MCPDLHLTRTPQCVRALPNELILPYLLFQGLDSKCGQHSEDAKLWIPGFRVQSVAPSSSRNSQWGQPPLRSGGGLGTEQNQGYLRKEKGEMMTVTKSVDLSGFHCFPPNSGALKPEYLHVSAQAWPLAPRERVALRLTLVVTPVLLLPRDRQAPAGHQAFLPEP